MPLSTSCDRATAFGATISLPSWLGRAALAGVPAIPGRVGPTISTDTIFAVLDEQELTERQITQMERARRWLGSECPQSRTMWRWDVCASSDIKFAMSEPGDSATRQARVRAANTHEDRPFLIFDDSRLLDIVMETDRKGIAPVSRPWCDIADEGGYPVEFRAYSFANAAIAVSSYYPQRPLSPEWARAIPLVRQATTRLQRVMIPQVPFTVDFVVRAQADALTVSSNDVLLLEGGPGWGFGGHPCCFAPASLEAMARGGPTRDLLAAEAGAIR